MSTYLSWKDELQRAKEAGLLQENPALLQNSPPWNIDELPRIQASLQGENSTIDSLTLSTISIKHLWGFKKNFSNKSEFGDELG
jgi:hypothetical protein